MRQSFTNDKPKNQEHESDESTESVAITILHLVEFICNGISIINDDGFRQGNIRAHCFLVAQNHGQKVTLN
ncbi:hypothetical protein ACJIZ3_011621 [Penstemon smallii]|uniref:Uncharacterized protein n=1 Tax=Penstemon smallii TaxID=265156 RepID=A0ABD3UJM3_9LAMI